MIHIKNPFDAIQHCRSCSRNSLDQILDLGQQPLANSLRSVNDKSKEEAYPLSLFRCDNCTTLQLSVNVNPEIMFNSYFWVTGTSASTREYCINLTKSIMDRCNSLDPNILEIGSNDGTLLFEFSKLTKGKIFGIDPAKNILPKTSSENIKFISEFFNEDFASKFVAQNGKVDVVIARNVLSHVSDLNDVMRGIDIILDDEGVCIIEFHDAAKIISEIQYDSIYHEHTYYHSIKSMTYALKSGNLKPFDATLGPISGGCVVLYSSKSERPDSAELVKNIKREMDLGVYSLQKWKNFGVEALRNIAMIRDIFSNIESGDICAFGASARSSTLLNSVGKATQVLKGIADNNTLKWGLVSPGTELLIYNPEILINDSVSKIFISAFNFENEIVKEIKTKLNWTGEIITPLPNTIRRYNI